MERIPRIFDGSTQGGSISRRTALLRTMVRERRDIENYDSAWEDNGLDAHLRRLYDLEVREQERLWRLRFEAESRAVAERLLEVEEQINLLDYEIGLDIFRRLKASDAKLARDEKLSIPYDSKEVYYEFEDEFWNDELHSYEYFAGNRCFGEAPQ